MIHGYVYRVGIYLIAVTDPDELNKDVLEEMKEVFKSDQVVLIHKTAKVMFSDNKELEQKNGLIVNGMVGYAWLPIPVE